MSEHIAAEVLAAYVDGTLPNGARQEAESHLCRCRECRRELIETGEIRSNRTEVPQEFLRRALDLAGENSRQMNASPNRNVLPLRLAFGVAAVFLVALAVGYLFIGRERPGLPEFTQKQKEEPTVAPEQGSAPAPLEPAVTVRGAADAARAQAPAQALPDLEAKKKLASEVAPAASPVKSPVPTDAAMRQERQREADKTSAMLLREGEGGVIGGVEAPPQKDNLAAAKLAAPAPGRDKGLSPRKAEAQVPRFSGSGTAADAMQLFLAATGRASAPRLPQAEASFLPLPVEIRGDVTEEDLLEPWPLAGWAWLPAGSRLQVTIAADGSVSTVELLGRWETGAAAQARTAAAKLVFSASAQKIRRAVLSREPLN